MKPIITFLCFVSLLFFVPNAISAQTVGHTQTGIASFYSDEFEGDITAYNEAYHKNDLVAAHSLYPHNSRVGVTNLSNNKYVEVRVIDQGPWIEGRIIEVSRKAADLLGFTTEGTTRVKLELLSTPDQPAVAGTRAAAKPNHTNTRKANEVPAPAAPDRNAAPREPLNTTKVVETPSKVSTSAAVVAAPKTAQTVEQTRPTTQPSRASQQNSTKKSSDGAPKISRYAAIDQDNPMITDGKFDDGIYKIELRQAGPGAFGVQIASLKDIESTIQQVSSLQGKWFDNILVKKTGGLYKLILGPFSDQATASRYAKDLKKRYKINGFTVELK